MKPRAIENRRGKRPSTDFGQVPADKGEPTILKGQKKKVFPAGARLFAEHERADFAYLIESGNVELSASNQGKSVVLTSVGPGEILGEMALIDDFTRTATAVATEETTVIPIDRSTLQEKISSSDPVTQMLLRIVLQRFRWALRRALDHERLYSSGTETLAAIDTRYERAREYAINRLKLEQDLGEAIEGKQFRLYYQPIVRVGTGTIAGFEALIRWQHPERGLVSPLDFVPAAEETGLIIPIGEWVLERACRDLPRFQQVFASSLPGRPPLFMSVNVSPRQIEYLASEEKLPSILDRVGIHPSRVKLEITEELLIRSPEMAARTLAKLKDAGVFLAIDDFGTGYSSMSYLHSFPLDLLKIDRAFIQSMRRDKKSRKIVNAIIRLAEALGLEVVAEGIEDVESLKHIRKLECDFFQGYLASRPLSLKKMLKSLERHCKGRAGKPGAAPEGT